MVSSEPATSTATGSVRGNSPAAGCRRLRSESTPHTVTAAASCAPARPRVPHFTARRSRGWTQCLTVLSLMAPTWSSGAAQVARVRAARGALDSTPMSTISAAEVARVAALARIELTQDEIERLAGELDVIADAVAKVSEVVGPDVPATSHPLPLTNVMRDDVVEEPLSQEEALSGAPASEDGQFLVPQILGEDA